MLGLMGKALFQFFTSDKTPNSSFYVTSGAIVAALTTSLTASNEPWLMGIGGGLAAAYTLGHNYAEAKKAQAAAEAFNATVRPSIRLAGPALPTTPLSPEEAAAIARQVAEHLQAARAPEHHPV